MNMSQEEMPGVMRRVGPEQWAFVPSIIPEGGVGGAIGVPVGPVLDPPGEPFALPFIDESIDPVGEAYNRGFETVSEIADFVDSRDLCSSTPVNLTTSIQPPSSIVNAFVVTDSSPNANLKFRDNEAAWINNLFLKGPSGGTSRFLSSITELYPTPNEAVLKKVDLCKESFELLELGQGRGSARNLSPIHSIAEKGLTSIHRLASVSAGVLHALAGGEADTVTAVSALFQLVGAIAFSSSDYRRRLLFCQSRVKEFRTSMDGEDQFDYSPQKLIGADFLKHLVGTRESTPKINLLKGPEPSPSFKRPSSSSHAPPAKFQRIQGPPKRPQGPTQQQPFQSGSRGRGGATRAISRGSKSRYDRGRGNRGKGEGVEFPLFRPLVITRGQGDINPFNWTAGPGKICFFSSAARKRGNDSDRGVRPEGLHQGGQTLRGSDTLTHFPEAKVLRKMETNFGSVGSEQIGPRPEVPVGISRLAAIPSSKGGMDGKSGPGECLLQLWNPSGGSETPKVCVAGYTVGISGSSKRTEIRPFYFHQDPEASSRLPQEQGCPSYHLSRRYLDHGPGQGHTGTTHRPGDPYINKVRFPHKLGEIGNNTDTAHRVFGFHHKLNRHDLQHQFRETGENPRTMPPPALSGRGPGEVSSQPTRNATGSRQSPGSSETTLPPASDVQDWAHQTTFECSITSLQSSSHQECLSADQPTDSGSKIRDPLVGRELDTASPGPNRRDGLGSGDLLRCLSDRMGSLECRRRNSGGLGPLPSSSTDQRTRIQGSDQCTPLFHRTPAGHQGPLSSGQQSCEVLHQKDGRDSLPGTIGPRVAVLESCTSKRTWYRSGLHPLSGEHSCGFVLENHHQVRVQLGTSGFSFSPSSQEMGLPQHRSVCLHSQQEGNEISIMGTGKGSSRERCFQLGLGLGGPVLCLPQFQPGNQGAGEAEKTPRDHHDTDSPGLEDQTLVPNAPGDVCEPTSDVRESLGSNSGPQLGTSRTTMSREASSVGLVNFIESRKTEGFSEEVSQVMAGRWKPTSIKTYNSAWRAWYSWCSERQIDSLLAPTAEVANFLWQKAQEGAEYRYLGVLRSAISMFAKAREDGTRVGETQPIKDLMKGLWRRNTPRVRYTATWSIDTVLSFYEKVNIPNEELSWKELTIKVALLLSINLIGRAGDLNKLLADNYSEEDHCLKLLLKEPLKQQRSGVLAPLTVYVQENVRICPVAATLTYIYKSREFRQLQDGKNRDRLFLSLAGKHANVTSSTVSRWILLGLEKVGIDTSTYKAHSVRSATVSSLAAKGLSLSRILKRGKWKSRSVFKKHYLRVL